MSLIAWARSELESANLFEGTPSEKTGNEAIIKVLEIFFDEFDSGGAVHATIPILQSLLCGRPLRPLTGDAEEWFDPIGTAEEPGTFLQNKRCFSVFKTLIDLPHRGFKAGDAYDINEKPRKVIVFPYMPPRRTNVSPPEVEL